MLRINYFINSYFKYPLLHVILLFYRFLFYILLCKLRALYFLWFEINVLFHQQTECLAFLESMWSVYAHLACAHMTTKHTNAWPTYICRRLCTLAYQGLFTVEVSTGPRLFADRCATLEETYVDVGERSVMEIARGNLPFIYIAIVCNPFLLRKMTQSRQFWKSR